MAIVSVSLPDDLVKDIDHAIQQRDFKGRSQFLRAALRDYLLTTKAAPHAHGHVHGSITIVYPHGKEARVGEVRHAHHDVVLSLMHTHCEEQTCMDVLIVGGPANRVQALYDDLERMRDVERARLVIMR